MKRLMGFALLIVMLIVFQVEGAQANESIDGIEDSTVISAQATKLEQSLRDKNIDNTVFQNAEAKDIVRFYSEKGIDSEKLNALIEQDPEAMVNLTKEAVQNNFTAQQIDKYIDGLLRTPTVYVHPWDATNRVTKDAEGTLVTASGETHPDTTAGKFTTSASDDVASTDVNLVINGKQIYSDEIIGAPYISSAGRTMFPLRIISENFGYSVVYTDGQVFIYNSKLGYSAQFAPGRMFFYVNEMQKPLDSPMIIRGNGRSYVPARALVETFGTVEWDEGTRTVTITSAKRDEPIPAEANDATYEIEVNEATGALYVARSIKGQEGKTLLAVPSDRYNAANRYSIYTVKAISGANYITIFNNSLSPSANFTVDVFKDNLSTKNELEYIGFSAMTGDFVADDQYFYANDGLHQGPFGVEPKLLYVSKIGDPTTIKRVELAFDVNQCKLSIENGQLIAVDQRNGEKHTVDLKEIHQ